LSPGQLNASLGIQGNTIREPGPFASKRRAKEAVAKRGLSLLESYAKTLDELEEKSKEEEWRQILYGRISCGLFCHLHFCSVAFIRNTVDNDLYRVHERSR
jgi:hypothetical protein